MRRARTGAANKDGCGTVTGRGEGRRLGTGRAVARTGGGKRGGGNRGGGNRGSVFGCAPEIAAIVFELLT